MDRPPRASSSRPLRRARALALLVALAAAGCSLGNVAHDACKSDAECAKAFGPGSTCRAGYCADPAATSSTTTTGTPTCGPTTGKNGLPCNDCPPKTPTEFHNACTGASCAPFDDANRLTKLTADGGLPPLPPPPDGGTP